MIKEFEAAMQASRRPELYAEMSRAATEYGGQTLKGMSSPLERLERISSYLKGPCSLSSLLELSAYGRSLEAEYKAHGIPVPKWLPESLRTLKGAIAETWRREREEKLRKAEAELEELKSKEERRVAKAREVEDLRKELGYDGDSV